MNNDLLWLAINAYHEAQGEPFEGQVAVCQVVMNRAEKAKKSVKETILKPWQFSWANNGARPPVKDYTALEASYAAAQECLIQRSQGLTREGADHYFATSGPNAIQMPSWAAGMNYVCEIGHHTFFRS